MMGEGRWGMDRRVLIILAIAGWILALAIGVAFAWFALWGPGSSRAPSDAEFAPSAAATVTPAPSATPTSTPTDTLTPFPTPPPPTSPLPTPAQSTPTLTPTATASATLVAGEGGANVRSGPGANHDLLGTLEEGETAVINGQYEDWYLIEFDGAPGWIASWVVKETNVEDVPQVDATGAIVATPAAPEATPTATLVAGEDGANVRSGPGTGYDRIGTLQPGDSAVVTGRVEEWYRIDFDGAPGWVAGWVVEVTDGESVPLVELPEAAGSTPVTPAPTVVGEQ